VKNLEIDPAPLGESEAGSVANGFVYVMQWVNWLGAG
jgi:hypothetical protein